MMMLCVSGKCYNIVSDYNNVGNCFFEQRKKSYDEQSEFNVNLCPFERFCLLCDRFFCPPLLTNPA